MCTLCGIKKDKEWTFLASNIQIGVCRDCLQKIIDRLDEVSFEDIVQSEEMPEAELKTPRQIKALLDRRIIGQEQAK